MIGPVTGQSEEELLLHPDIETTATEQNMKTASSSVVALLVRLLIVLFLSVLFPDSVVAMFCFAPILRSIMCIDFLGILPLRRGYINVYYQHYCCRSLY